LLPASFKHSLADSLVGVEHVTGNEGVFVALVVVFDILRHFGRVSDKLFKSASLAQVLDELGVLGTDLVDQAFFLLEELLEGKASLLFENLGDLALCDAVRVTLRKDVVQHIAHLRLIVFL